MSAADKVASVMKGTRFIVSKGGQEPTIHELACAFYKSLGATPEEVKQWAGMYVNVASSVIARDFPIQERSVPAQKHRIALYETEEGLLAKAKEMADAIVQDMVAELTQKISREYKVK